MSVAEGDAAAIGNLVWNWGEAYVISYANGLYHAERRDNGAQVHAPDPEQLGREIQADYSRGRYPGSCLSGRCPSMGRAITPL